MAQKKTTEKFIEESKNIYGDRFSYEKTKYEGATKKVIITCKKHGDFETLPLNFLRGHSCPTCGIDIQKSKIILSNNEFIQRASRIHGDKYDYSKINYINSHTIVDIICKKHGIFKQTPNSHLSGCGCPQCGNEEISIKNSSSIEDFIEKARKTHGDMYDYSLSEYKGCEAPINIICKKHGIFKQKPIIHLQGCGCPKCKSEKSGSSQKSNTEDFIEKVYKVHGDKYDYSKVKYINSKTNVCIVCPTHGDFWITPNNLLRGQGCAKCSIEYSKTHRRISINEVMLRANEIHNNKYNYSLLDYNNEKDKVKIICPIHGVFEQTLDSHLRGAGCPICAKQVSNPEIEIIDFIHEKDPSLEILNRDRCVIAPYEIDIYFPSLKIGIEYNGLIWHSDKFNKDINKEIKKTLMCEKEGIKLIQIFEDEYLTKKEIVLKKITHLLGLNKNLPNIMGRKCEIKVISKKDAEVFLNKNHIQGFVRASVYLGGFYSNHLIAVMSFLRIKNSYELVRFAGDINYRLQGVGSKMFSFFVKTYNPDEIKSFADRRWTNMIDKTLYDKLGFYVEKILPPDYKYYNNKDGTKRQHKFYFRKKFLKKRFNADIEHKTEDEITKELGYFKIWDCGLIKYIWRAQYGTTSKTDN